MPYFAFVLLKYRVFLKDEFKEMSEVSRILLSLTNGL